MNKQQGDILNILVREPFINQRKLAGQTGHSLGIVNRCLKELVEQGYLDPAYQITEKTRLEYKEKSPKRAIILAAGYGMRMIPINREVPKGLVEVRNEPLIERLLRQLDEVGIKEIYIVVGFLKEKYEYLIDEYGVKLIVNNKYSERNNLHSLNLVAHKMNNAYIIPCDIWCRHNPFRAHEIYSWYMVSDSMDYEGAMKINKKMELVKLEPDSKGNKMIGISYLTIEKAEEVRTRMVDMCKNRRYDNAFWEEALMEKGKMTIHARIVSSAEVIEINTYEQLRDLDNGSNQLKDETMDVICDLFQVKNTEIKNINVLKKGMTNRSFLFECQKEKYIMRVPGEGTDHLINRKEEAQVYKAIAGRGVCDDPVYINPDNGYKITKYLNGVRVCNQDHVEDLKKCMAKLKEFHDMRFQVDHEFNLFEQILFYEKLWNGNPSVYKDYEKTKMQVFRLKEYIDGLEKERTLTHIDAVPDNFLFHVDEHGEEQLQLTDWEYAGMQDPHVDIAMFCIYSLYEREQVDRLIDIYFDGGCDKETRIKIYCYIAVCGLLWSNWCEYKRNLGIEFGEYSLRQYRYAKDYYTIAIKEIDTVEGK